MWVKAERVRLAVFRSTPKLSVRAISLARRETAIQKVEDQRAYCICRARLNDGRGAGWAGGAGLWWKAAKAGAQVHDGWSAISEAIIAATLKPAHEVLAQQYDGR